MNGTASNYLAGQLSIGTTSLTEFVNIANSTNGVTRVLTTNTNAGTATQVQYQLGNGTHTASLGLTGSSFTASGVFLQGGTYLSSGNSAGGLLLNTGAAQPIYFGVNNAEVARFGTNGALGIGSISLTGFSLLVGKNLTGGTSVRGISQEGFVQSDATTAVYGIRNVTRTATASFTISDYQHFLAVQATLGAGSAITNQYGFVADSTLISGVNNFGFYGNIPSAANRWNLYMNGTAANFMAGKLLIGSTTDSGATLQVTGTARFTGDVELNGASGTRTLTIQNNTSGNAVLSLVAAGSDSGSITYNRSTSQLVFANSGATSAFVIANTGAATFSSSVGATQFVSQGGRGNTFGYKMPDWQIYNTTSGNALAFSNYSIDCLTIASSGAATFSSNVEISAGDLNFGSSGKGVFLSRSGLGPRASLTTRTNTNWVDIANSSDWSGATICASGGNVLIATTTDNGQGKLQVNGAITATNISYTGELVTTSTTFNTTYYHIISGAVGSGQTYTLPSPSSNNLQYVIINKSNFSQTISAGSGFTIYNMAGSDVASITLASKARCYIIADGSGFYQIF
jgi:hypothetical protein